MHSGSGSRLAWPRIQPRRLGRGEPGRARLLPAGSSTRLLATSRKSPLAGALWLGCSSRFRTPVAGRMATPRRGSPSTRRSSVQRAGRSVPTVDDLQQALVHRLPRLVRGQQPRTGIRTTPSALTAVHHLDLAHGLGVRGAALDPSRRGTATAHPQPRGGCRRPTTPEADAEAVRHVDRLGEPDLHTNPVLRGRYPKQDLLDDLAAHHRLGVHQGQRRRADGRRRSTSWASTTTADAGRPAATPELRAQVDDSWGEQVPEWSEDQPSPFPGADLAFAVPQGRPGTGDGLADRAGQPDRVAPAGAP